MPLVIAHDHIPCAPSITRFPANTAPIPVTIVAAIEAPAAVALPITVSLAAAVVTALPIVSPNIPPKALSIAFLTAIFVNRPDIADDTNFTPTRPTPINIAAFVTPCMISFRSDSSCSLSILSQRPVKKSLTAVSMSSPYSLQKLISELAAHDRTAIASAAICSVSTSLKNPPKNSLTSLYKVSLFPSQNPLMMS